MSPRILTTAPIVTELPLALEPVEPDPFLVGLALAPPPRASNAVTNGRHAAARRSAYDPIASQYA